MPSGAKNLDDLFQVGCIGLIKAIDNLAPAQPVRFSTYGVTMIIGEIRRFLRDNNALRVSRSLRDTAYRAMQARETLEKQLGRPPRREVGPVHRLCQRPADAAGLLGTPTPTFLYFTAEFFARPFQNRVVGVAVGTFMAGFLRFMCSFLSGVLIWGNLTDGLPAWTYSLVYNGSYMLPETLLTMVAAVLLCRVAPQIFDRQHAKA